MTASTFEAVPISELHDRLRKERPGARFLIEGLVRRVGVHLLVGASHSGKTTFAAALSAAVATGTDFLGHRTTTQGPVWWVYEDRDVQPFCETMEKILAGTGGASDVHVVQPAGWSLDDAAHVEDLRSRLDDHGVAIVVVDCLRRVTTADENSSADISAIHSQLAKLCDGRRAVIVIHHAGGGGRPRGSTDLTAGAEAVLAVTTSEAGVMTLDVRHHTAPALTLRSRRVITDEFIRFELLAASASADRDGADVRSAIIGHLRHVDGSSHQDVGKAIRSAGVRAGHKKITTTLAALVREGVIREGKQGRAKCYSLVALPSSPELLGGDSGRSVTGRDISSTPRAPDVADPRPHSPASPLKGGEGEEGGAGQREIAGVSRGSSGELDEAAPCGGTAAPGQRELIMGVVRRLPVELRDRWVEEACDLEFGHGCSCDLAAERALANLCAYVDEHGTDDDRAALRTCVDPQPA